MEHLGTVFPGKKPLVVLSAGRAQRIQVSRASHGCEAHTPSQHVPRLQPARHRVEASAATSSSQKLDPALRTFFAKLEEQGSFFVTPFGSNDDW